MKEKPKLVNILVITWIIIGAIFVISVIENHYFRTDLYEYNMDADEFYIGSDSEKFNLFYSVADFTIEIVFSFLSFIFAFLFYKNKYHIWFSGTVLSSFLFVYCLYQPFYLVGYAVFDITFQYHWVFTIIIRSVLFALSCVIFYILTRKEIKIFYNSDQLLERISSYRNY